MKKTISFIICLSVFVCVSFQTSAQTYSTSADVDDIKEEIRQLMAVFIKYLGDVGRTKTFQSNDSKKLLGIVEDYFISSAIIEVSFLDKNGRIKVHPYPYKQYLREVVPKYPERFAYVHIEAYPYSIDSLKLKPIIEGNKIIGYECEVKYKQIWAVSRKDGIFNLQNEVPITINDYDQIDKDIKSTRVIIKKQDTTSGSVWNIKIGNIKVEDTKIITRK